MEIRTGKYTNFILTVIAVLMAGLLFQVSVGIVANAHAQRLEETDTRLDGVREYQDYRVARNQQQASVQEDVNSNSDQAVAQGLVMLSGSIRDVATAIREVAQSNSRIAEAVRSSGSNVTVTAE